MAFASVVIGAHAALFLAFAVHHGNEAAATDCVLLLVAIGLANGLIDMLRSWRRHHS